jgi:hypothetical protein
MSLVSEARTKAESVLEQGRQALAGFVGQASTADIKIAGFTVSVDSLTSEAEEALRRYKAGAAGRVGSVVSGLKNDERLAKLVQQAETLVNEIAQDKRVAQVTGKVEGAYDALIDTLLEVVVKPLQDLIAKPAAPAESGVPDLDLSPVVESTDEPIIVPAVAKSTPAKAPAKRAPAKRVAKPLD